MSFVRVAAGGGDMAWEFAACEVNGQAAAALP